VRIALFSETFLPKVDGIVNTLCYLLKHLEKRGHESVLFAPTGAPARYHSTRILTYDGFPFPLYPELKLVPPTVHIRQQLALFQPDVVHVVQPIALGVTGMWHARRLGIPVVASYHTDVPGFAAQWGLGWLQGPIWATFRTIHQQADLNLCPSYTTLRQLREHHFPKVSVWTRGVDTRRFQPQWRSETWREYLTNGRSQSPLLLYVGRLSAEKRVEWLRPLLDQFPDARLAIVGDGPARTELETLFAGTNTIFTGYLGGHDLAQAYAAADIFTFPSANETLGNVLLEAMASGLAVVAAASGGPLDIVYHNRNGLLFQPDSPADFAAKVGTLLQDAALRHQLSQRARHDAAQRDWATVLDGLLENYAEVMVRKRPFPTPKQKNYKRQSVTT
jgi:glycosyltransferase involved in cell wall biosynthesis